MCVGAAESFCSCFHIVAFSISWQLIFLPLFHCYHPRQQRKLFVLSRYFDFNTLTSESFLTLERLELCKPENSKCLSCLTCSFPWKPQQRLLPTFSSYAFCLPPDPAASLGGPAWHVVAPPLGTVRNKVFSVALLIHLALHS